MAEISNAWLLDVGAGMQVAVADNEIVEYLRSPIIRTVPLTPPYCSSVVFWRDQQMLPLFNLALLTQPQFDTNTEHLGVLAYQARPKTPLRHIGIALYAPPEKILVRDDDACSWPEYYPEFWTTLTLALFTHNGMSTPILDIAGLCAGSVGV